MLRKNPSNDSLSGLGLFIRQKSENEPRRTLIWEDYQNKKEQGLSVFKKKIRKQRKKNICDYRKNICGYITKKIIREYLGSTYLKTVTELCKKHGCSYSQSKTYYISRIERVTGPSHVPLLLVPESPEEVNIKGAFREFFEWFLKERYLRYLLIDGKMENKSAYIQYKNANLMLMINLDYQLTHNHSKDQPQRSNQQMSQTSL